MRKRFEWALGVALLMAAGCASSDEAETAPPRTISAVGLNDVSILFPLPAPNEVDLLLKLDTAGKGGPLFPRDLYARMAPLQKNEPPIRTYESFRVVGARIDPCFPDARNATVDPSKCVRQVRLSVQPLQANGAEVVAVDHAIHLLYSFDEATFAALAKKWVQLQTDTTAKSETGLGVHPTIASEGLSGPTFTALRELLVANIGAANLVEATFIEGGFTVWTFGGLKRGADGQFTDAVIPGVDTSKPVGLGGTRQNLSTSDSGEGFFSVDPPSDASKDLATFAFSKPTGDEQRRVSQLALDLESPTSAFNPGTVDCATCHLASRAIERSTSLGVKMPDDLTRYKSTRNVSLALDASAKISFREIRSFGYNGRLPIISQRTVNQSDLIATALMPKVVDK